MIKIIYLCVLLIISGGVLGQEDISNRNLPASQDLYQMYQKKGTEANVSLFFSKSNYKFNSDTVIVIFLKPMICARCEGTINPFIQKIYEKNSNDDVCIIAFSKKKQVLQNYFNKRKYFTDKVMASTDEQLLKNFFFNTGELSVPFYTLIDVSAGKLLYSKSSLGAIIDDDFINEITSPDNNNSYMIDAESFVEDSSDDVFYAQLDNFQDLHGKILSPVKTIDCLQENENPISTIQYTSFSKDNLFLSFMNQLDYSIHIQQYDGFSYKPYSVLTANDSVEKIYVSTEVSDSVYQILKFMNIPNAMFFKSWIEDDTVFVIGSLPNIYWENIKTESLVYYNKPTLLSFGMNSKKLLKVMSFEKSDSSLILKHTKTMRLNDLGLLFVPVVKGWPVQGTSQLDSVEIESNPFIDSFYDVSPSFAIYNNKGQFIKYFHHLEQSFVDNYLGYYFSKPIVKYTNDWIVIVEAMTGMVSFYNSIDDVRPFRRINTIDQIDYHCYIDQTEKPLEYIKNFENKYKDYVYDFFIDNEKIFLVYKNKAFFYYKIYSLNGEFLGMKYFPNKMDGGDVLDIKISKRDGDISANVIYNTLPTPKIQVFLLKVD